MHSTVVVLPAPLGPRIPKISPRRMSSEIPSTATVAPVADAQVLHRDDRVDGPSFNGFGHGAQAGNAGAPSHRPSGCFASTDRLIGAELPDDRRTVVITAATRVAA